ncbi:hypothetical protein PVL29_023705 [Vitis rotundifolia]|uniref:Uncharacterized protein n=1 Tax=Vitis rotundifolia TaxID=103349 RepID=A0AA38YPR2_VITRO|nr:hypothetical protein PVL29_023705 [Vitis rotundifolia]
MGSSVDASATETDGDTTETDIDVDADSDADDYPPLSDSCPFSEGEKVLAYHNLRIYPAKVRRIEFQMNEWKYFVHYLGWSKNWDEWVGMDRLLKFSEENVQKQKALGKKQGIDKNTKPVRASQIKPKNFARGKKWKNDSVAKEAIPVEKLVNIQIPPTLKKQLVDDCEFITHLGQLVRLPRAPTVDKILKKYLDYRIKRDGMISDSAGEILKGLRCYFDKALPVMLLYERERQQYQEAIANNVSPSTIYGAEHLLRLFVKLPELLFHANIEKETSKELQLELLDFLNGTTMKICKIKEISHSLQKNVI